ncbi:MAG: sulfatase-like hydrolase/transferase [Oligoflexia bacterium]|nr:sulfatase-like hydrolase/transferase [Oligoflexia bacterium]
MLATLLMLVACSGTPVTRPAVILISWDTTRADALSAYADSLPIQGGPAAQTPTADALAAHGVRFAWALAHAPTTLASHTSIMSGRDTHKSAVPRNGYPVPPGFPLLAQRFEDAGWDRLAVVGASTLDHRMGLSRGFRVYDDHLQTHVRNRYEDRADRVTARALLLADQRQDRPLFLFVHYFDPHSPWDSAPRKIRARFLDDPAAATQPGPFIEKMKQGTFTKSDAAQARAAYLAEVAWTDQQTGLLLDGLRRKGLLDDALVVLLADHGEALDDPGMAPYGHGLNVDLPAIHVPLILSGTGHFALPAGTVVQAHVRLLDVGSTILAAAGLDPSLGDGKDLAPLWTAAAAGQPLPDTPPSFAEATKPVELEPRDGWNNRNFERSVADDGHFLTVAPFLHQGPSLYRLAPGQPLATPDPAETSRLVGLLSAWDAAAPPHRSVFMDQATIKALQALGYVAQ